MTEQPLPKPVIGIVGGIGAGKSTVAREFAKLGCSPIDADAIGHDLLAEPDVRSQLLQRWGREIFGPDGAVDRRKLAEIVFRDAAELEALDAILHPRIRCGIERCILAAQDDPKAVAVVLDAAVLFEAGWDDLCTHTVFVSASSSRRKDRACAARDWDEQTWRIREKSQISLDKKVSKCDYTIGNSSSVSCLRDQVREILSVVVHVVDRS